MLYVTASTDMSLSWKANRRSVGKDIPDFMEQRLQKLSASSYAVHYKSSPLPSIIFLSILILSSSLQRTQPCCI